MTRRRLLVLGSLALLAVPPALALWRYDAARRRAIDFDRETMRLLDESARLATAARAAEAAGDPDAAARLRAERAVVEAELRRRQRVLGAGQPLPP